MQETNELSLL